MIEEAAEAIAEPAALTTSKGEGGGDVQVTENERLKLRLKLTYLRLKGDDLKELKGLIDIIH